ncbi:MULTISPECIES: type IV pilus modification PilV family protein [Vibrio]|uniref:type IV pilus modification PilV family protein n=1 Tax=Vibrio TaxID=662 RepID=UPI00056F22AD|nr:prepilin-type N-terminal cleavage/methylation domain-containing protein [Vibrio pacinii]
MLSSRQGFSLIEVLVALAMISLASLGLTKLQVSIEQRADFAVNSVVALNLAEQQLEWFGTRGAVSEYSASEVADFALLQSGAELDLYAPYQIRWHLSSVPGWDSNGLQQVQINVSWPQRNGNRQSISILTLLSAQHGYHLSE